MKVLLKSDRHTTAEYDRTGNQDLTDSLLQYRTIVIFLQDAFMNEIQGSLTSRFLTNHI